MLSTEYKIIYMRFKHQFDPKEIAGLLDIPLIDVRHILAMEALECQRQRELTYNEGIKERYQKHQRKGDNALLTQNKQFAQ